MLGRWQNGGGEGEAKGERCGVEHSAESLCSECCKHQQLQ